MASNIIQLSFNGETSVVSEELVYKYDYGQQIEFTDLTLPEYFEVHFSNNKTGKATKQIGHNGVVDIPDRYLEIGSVYGWIFLHNTDSDGETEYEFKIPVKNRAMPSDGEVTPEQESAISQAIAALTSTQASVQALHDETEGYRDDASASSTSASASQDAAETAQDLAETAQGLAEDAQTAAEDAQSAAEIAQGKAEDAQTAAESAQAAAEAARDDVLGMSAEAETLPAGSSATASYADGVLSLGIPRGDKGETGDTGATGETGNGIASVVKTSTSGLVDTYTITYTDGTTSTFDVTNGKDGEDSDVLDVQIDGTSILSDGVANIPTADTYYTSRYGVVKLADVVEGGDNYNTIQLKYTRQGSAKSKTLATSAVATTSKRGLMSKDDKAKLDGIASGAEVNVQSDWNQTNTSADDYIKNKPSVPTKVSDLENDVPYVEESSLKSALPTDTASGDIASFSDGTDLFPALSVKAQIEPIQSGSGTPSPDNVRPISGRTEVVTHRTGKNLLPNILTQGSSSVVVFGQDNSTDFDIGLKAGTYTISVQASKNVNFYMRKSTDSGNTHIGNYNVKNATFTLESDADIRIWAYVEDGLSVSDISTVQLELGTTATDYEAFDGQTYTTTLGRTVYGGTLDVVSGELVVDRAMVDLGTLDWNKDANHFYSSIVTDAKAPSSNGVVANIVSSNYGADTATRVSAETVDGTIAMNANRRILVYDSTLSSGTASDFKTAMSGVQLCYELATPQTYQLTPQEVQLLLGQNNVWTDCGSVEVTYKADTQKYIDKKFAELQALVLEQ